MGKENKITPTDVQSNNSNKIIINKEEIIMNNVGVITTGGGAANCCTLLTGKKYLTMAYNTTEDDMYGVEATITMVPENLGGSGKQADFATAEFKKIHKKFFEVFDEHFKEKKYIFIISTTCGGSGSGTAPMLAKLLRMSYDDKHIIVIGLLGSIKEDMQSQRNLLKFITAVDTKSDVPYCLFDNDASKFTNIDDIYNDINHEVMQAIRIISGEYYTPNNRQNIDKRDKSRLFENPGRFCISSFNINNSANIEAEMIENIKAVKCIPPSNYQVDKYGVYLNINEDLYDNIDANFPKMIYEIGRKEDVCFKHLQSRTDSDNVDCPDVAIIITGLEPPIERMIAVKRKIDDYEKFKSSKRTLADVGFGEVEKKITPLPTDNHKGNSKLVSDCLNDF
jgi:hypothetical protein